MDSDRQTVAAFYIVRKLENPVKTRYFVCPEAGTPVEHNVEVKFVLDFNFIANLSDDSLLFGSETKSRGLLILRLDRSLRQRSTLGGKVFVLNAASINDNLKPADNDAAFYHSFATAIAHGIDMDRGEIKGKP